MPKLFEKVKNGNIAELQAGEKAYELDKQAHTFQPVTTVPRSCPEYKDYFAIQVIPANVRIILYSLNTNKILHEFDRLKNEGVTGWSLAGSNVLTRCFAQETSENCASLAYRCLKAGGLYDSLNLSLSSETSSAVAPDDFLRHVVAAKEKELTKYPQTTFWSIEGCAETSLVELKIKFEEKKSNANAEDDWLPQSKPSQVICVLL